MPKVAEIVDGMRRDFGKAWVDDCITAAVKGEPNRFYACERGHVVGTPFTLDAALDECVRLAFMTNGAAAVIRRPNDGQNSTR